MNPQDIWKAVLGELELTVSRANFTTWLKNTFALKEQEGEMIVAVPNIFTKSWLENKYHKVILAALQHVTENKVRRICYNVQLVQQQKTHHGPREQQKQTIPIRTLPSKPPQIQIRPGGRGEEYAPTIFHNLNPRYTFETFVVGKTNELARAAAMAVVEDPGNRYNPLFLFGGVGLGKTHLMQAIGHEIYKTDQNKRILYITCEDFTNDFIRSVSKGTINSFKDTYRSVDVLLVDDIQFLAGKEGTQEEFFHTFNTLHQANKQIVLSSDRPPKAIPSLELRLVSRFEWGMTADISNPDLETRIAILAKKCEEKGFLLPNDVLALIAQNIQSNIRELEGVLNKVIAHHEFNNISVSVTTVQELLERMNMRPRLTTSITTKKILIAVAQFFEVEVDELTSNSRRRELVTPRQISMYLMREELKSSYPNIGEELGGRDHTTAMHAYAKISDELIRDEKLKNNISLLRERLYSS